MGFGVCGYLGFERYGMNFRNVGILDKVGKYDMTSLALVMPVIPSRSLRMQSIAIKLVYCVRLVF